MPTQRHAIGQIAELRGFTIVEWFEDPDLSAFKKGVRRPGYESMMARVADVDAVIFYRLDRFCRRLAQFARAYEACETAGVALVSATEPIDTSTPMGLAAMEMLMVFAGLEARTTATRLQDFHATLAREGRHSGGELPFGWRYDPDTKTVELDEAEAATIRAFAAAILRGWSSHRIAREARDVGVVGDTAVASTRRGGPWQHSAIVQLLRQERLVGDRTYRGVVVASGAFPPILTRAVWRDVQEALSSRTNAVNRKGAPKAPLTGILRCGTCDGPMAVVASGRRGVQYGCMNHPHRGGDCTKPVTVMAHVVEPNLRDRLFARLGEPELAAKVRDARRARAQAEPSTVERKKLGQQLARAERGYVEGIIVEVRFREIRAGIVDRLDRLPVAGPQVPSVASLRTLPALWELLDKAERRVLWVALVERVVVPASVPGRRHDPDGFHVDWRF